MLTIVKWEKMRKTKSIKMWMGVSSDSLYMLKKYMEMKFLPHGRVSLRFTNAYYTSVTNSPGYVL